MSTTKSNDTGTEDRIKRSRCTKFQDFYFTGCENTERIPTDREKRSLPYIRARLNEKSGEPRDKSDGR